MSREDGGKLCPHWTARQEFGDAMGLCRLGAFLDACQHRILKFNHSNVPALMYSEAGSHCVIPTVSSAQPHTCTDALRIRGFDLQLRQSRLRSISIKFGFDVS